MAIHGDNEQFRQAEAMGDHRSNQGADETNRNGDEKAAARSASDGSAQGAANSGDEQQKQEACQCERHGVLL